MVNILLSTYNGKTYLKEQLDSIFDQSYQDFILYVRDDGSSDNTVKLLRDYKDSLVEKDKMVIVAENNIGFCKSFFRLLSLSDDGDYWAFSDQDDIWYPDKLLNAVNWLDSGDNTKPLLYHSGLEYYDNDNIIGKYEIKGYDFNFPKSITSNIFYGFSMVINKSLRDKAVSCNPGKILYHDWFIAMIVTAFGEYHFSDVIDSAHRLHKSNASPSMLSDKIPLVKKLFTEESFYQRQAKEFKRLFWKDLSPENRKVLDLFDLSNGRVKKSFIKFSYPHRWNPRLVEEIGMRCLMLIGRI